MKLKFDLKKVKIIIFQNYVFLLTNKNMNLSFPLSFLLPRKK